MGHQGPSPAFFPLYNGCGCRVREGMTVVSWEGCRSGHPSNGET